MGTNLLDTTVTRWYYSGMPFHCDRIARLIRRASLKFAKLAKFFDSPHADLVFYQSLMASVDWMARVEHLSNHQLAVVYGEKVTGQFPFKMDSEEDAIVTEVFDRLDPSAESEWIGPQRKRP